MNRCYLLLLILFSAPSMAALDQGSNNLVLSENDVYNDSFYNQENIPLDEFDLEDGYEEGYEDDE